MTQSYSSPPQPPRQPATLDFHSHISGVGLHCGQNISVRLEPRAQEGIVFVRVDLPGAPEIAASFDNVTRTTHATTLEQDGVGVGTTEHLLAALWAMGVTACRVEINGPEVPILDGSARQWCEIIARSGLQSTLERPRAVWRLREPVAVTKGEGCVVGLPHPQLRLSTAVEYVTLWPSHQTLDMTLSPQDFCEQIAPARTFTLEAWIAPLQAAGLIRGGSVENAILLNDDGPSSPWRFENELARHKILDLIGDIALLFGAGERAGGTLQAHLVAVKAGHELHRRWMEQCLRQSALIRAE